MTPSILDAVRDPHLFAPMFRDPATWRSWFVFLKALFALDMGADELKTYQRFTARETAPATPAREAWLVVGRRGGKSFVVALVAVYLACFKDYAKHLAPGEIGVVMVIASDRKQARVILRYVKALLDGVPMLSSMVTRTTTECVDLSNRISIEVHTASYTSTRGYTVVAALLDEIAFWRTDDSANPDKEVLAAIRPAMATIPTSMLLCLSSAYARRGSLWETYRDHYGTEGDVLVWQADTRSMNATVPQSVIDDAYARDPVSAAAEYGAQFRSDVAGFLQEQWIDSAIVEGRHELPPLDHVRYHAFADPSGGARDSFTLAIGHNDKRVILDLCRGRRPPFDPSAVVRDYADILKRYRCHKVAGDRYAGRWVVEAFAKHGIEYHHCEKSKSEIYLESEPQFATGAVELLDHRQLLIELRQLERRTRSGGRDVVDHLPNAHDDYANSACGALWLASRTVVDLTVAPVGVGHRINPFNIGNAPRRLQ